MVKKIRQAKSLKKTITKNKGEIVSRELKVEEFKLREFDIEECHIENVSQNYRHYEHLSRDETKKN